MLEAERRTKKIKDTQELSRVNEELKKLDISIREFTQQIRTLEEEVVRKTSEFNRAKQEKERMVRFNPHEKHASGFAAMTAQAQADRAFGQVEREYERSALEMKGRVSDLRRKLFTAENNRVEVTHKKQTLERELRDIELEDEREKRKKLQEKFTRTETHKYNPKNIFE